MIRRNDIWVRGLLLALISWTFIACSHNDSSVPVAAETERSAAGTAVASGAGQDRTLDEELAAEYGNTPQENSLDRELEKEYETAGQAAQNGALKDEYDTESEQAHLADPLKYWNVAWFHFNDKLYFWVIKPVSKGYGAVVPRKARECIGNFLVNLQFPSRFLNTFLQARPHHSAVETGRFIVNTTWGFLGFWDPASTKLHWRRYDEDFDQTLGTWKIGQGCYLVWPFFGPSSPRGTIGLAVESALNPVPGGSVVRVVNDVSLDRYSYEQLINISVDPYVAVRDAYVQNRRELINERR